MNGDEQKLWDLMGRAPRPAAPPFFAAKVMRRIAAPEVQAGFPGLAVVLRWLAPATVAALVLFAVVPLNDPAGTEYVSANELTTLDLVELVSPEDYVVLTTAGWPYDNGFLTAGL
jgi:hypothetical protein